MSFLTFFITGENYIVRVIKWKRHEQRFTVGAINKKDITLPAGKYTLKLLMTAEGYNLNWFNFKFKSPTVVAKVKQH